MEYNKKDIWDKASVVARPLGTLFAALAVAGFGYFGSGYLNTRQDNETRLRLYTELISKREDAESALRKDMFTSIIGTFLKPETPKLEERVLQLELLAYNFHESLNLMPLFIHLNEQIKRDTTDEAKSYRKRISKVAREITGKQIAVLEGAGDKKDIEIDFSDSTKIILQKEINPKLDTLEIYQDIFDLQVETEKDTVRRSFRLTVLDYDTSSEEIRIRLEIRTSVGEFADDEFDKRVTIIDSAEAEVEELSDEIVAEGVEEFIENDFAVGDSAMTDSAEEDSSFEEFPEGDVADLIKAEFWVGHFDFPMIDNTRLPNDQRCAVVMREFEYPITTLTVIYFPSSHASLKEKPYYDEIVNKLLSKRSKAK